MFLASQKCLSSNWDPEPLNGVTTHAKKHEKGTSKHMFILVLLSIEVCFNL